MLSRLLPEARQQDMLCIWCLRKSVSRLHTSLSVICKRVGNPQVPEAANNASPTATGS